MKKLKGTLITKEFLKSKNACEEMVRLFNKCFPNGCKLNKTNLKKWIKIIYSKKSRRMSGLIFDNFQVVFVSLLDLYHYLEAKRVVSYKLRVKNRKTQSELFIKLFNL